MITISHHPAALAIREQQGPTGEPEVVVFGVDADQGIVVEICIPADIAAEFGQKLAAPRVDVATVADLNELRRNGTSG